MSVGEWILLGVAIYILIGFVAIATAKDGADAVADARRTEEENR